ncbi:MAG: hypothetical protein ABIN91_16550 [Mucilaginibacter sp.]|uniref:hypothetical protein n=1 Tax=Mucilaginibacter sp. TaxID=1882438 RepID=UPI0032631CD0
MRNVKPLLLAAAVASVFTACTQQPKSTETVAPTPILKDTIGEQTARRLVTNYNGRAHRFTRGELIFSDARCVWFSRDQLQALLTNIDKEDGDGIRFYLAAYDKILQSDLNKVNPAYQDFTTLVMVSTKFDKQTTHHIDYYTDGKGKAATLMAVPENQGELCPPPEKCDAIGATLLGTPPPPPAPIK